MTIDGGSAPLGAVNVDGIDRGMRDGAAVHAAALAAGFSTRLLPRQVLQVWTPGGETTSFTHGIPQSTTLAAVTYSQDLRMRRGLLGHEEISQPRGATFSVGRGRVAAKRYARKIGYPVVIKPALGDSTISVKPHVRNAIELDEAFDELLTPLRGRPGHTEAAYGITELRKPGWRKGEKLSLPDTGCWWRNRSLVGTFAYWCCEERSSVWSTVLTGRGGPTRHRWRTSVSWKGLS